MVESLQKSKLVVFTDLDGTLLDHDDYSYEAALPALQLLTRFDIPLILTSSKTKSEMLALRTELNNHHPFVVENGGAVYYPAGYFESRAGSRLSSKTFGKPYAEVIDIVNRLRTDLTLNFSGFNDWTVDEIVAHTGLSVEDAGNAKQRDCGEPILWFDDEQKLQVFKSRLAEYELRLLKGGRFHHVTGTYDKASAVEWLMEAYQARDECTVVSAALGDAGNDLEMLKSVDHAMVIPHKDGSRLELDGAHDVYYASRPGPSGWCEAVRNLVKTTFGEG
jgi:mannosyl-3-phosphoglycerate phosphatase